VSGQEEPTRQGPSGGEKVPVTRRRVLRHALNSYAKLQENIDWWKERTVSKERGKQLIYDIFQQKIVPVRLFHPAVRVKRTPSSRQKRAIIKIGCYTDEPKYTDAGVR
jgi:hypothetical protein